ncbi:hypothetical protein [Komagataeibacter europaeus]|uniref:hypothetical protein n=1 Tax=Komagataeibacter europaeus TaxID=33995 RepID=UPI000237D9C6|nr:hypothetical protein [Komagataeibacter europaeus]
MAARKTDRRYTPQDDALIRSMRTKGRTWTDIGRVFGVHGTSIRQRLIRVLQEDDPHPDAESLREAARRKQVAQQEATPARLPLTLRTRDGAFSIAALQMLHHQQAATELPRVYRRVKLSEDEPYGREEEDIAIFA